MCSSKQCTSSYLPSILILLAVLRGYIAIDQKKRKTCVRKLDRGLMIGNSLFVHNVELSVLHALLPKLGKAEIF